MEEREEIIEVEKEPLTIDFKWILIWKPHL